MFKRLTGSRLIFLCCARWLYGTTNSPWTPHVQSSILCTEAPFLAKFNVKLMVGKTTPGWWNRCTNWCAFEFRWCCFPYKICGRVYLNSQTFFLNFFFILLCVVSSFPTNLNSVLSECASLVFKFFYFSQGKTIILIITDQKVLTKEFLLDFIKKAVIGFSLMIT